MRACAVLVLCVDQTQWHVGVIQFPLQTKAALPNTAVLVQDLL